MQQVRGGMGWAPMSRALKWLGTGLLFLLVAVALTGALLPPLLDRHYYDGPVSDHYDGERFFNPGERGKRRAGFLSSRMQRFFRGEGKAGWPARVAVIPGRAYPATEIGSRTMVATWIGHATVLVQAGGFNILTDPIWSDRASPFGSLGPKRVRAPGIRIADLPKIDLIVVSHNHYDHMDLATLKALWDRDRPVIVTSLGNDTLLRDAGIPGRMDGPSHCGRCPGVEARDWGEWTITDGAIVRVERNHHWSSRRGADRNRALWSAFTITTPAGTIYYAGDTGIGDGRWAAEAAQRLAGWYGERVRLAILPIGAYAPREVMRDNHISPAESVRIFDTLRPGFALGVHWGTFQLTYEPIDAPRQWLARIRGGRRFVTSEVGRNIVVPEVIPLPFREREGGAQRRKGEGKPFR